MSSALVVCDAQPDLLNSLSEGKRNLLLRSLQVSIQATKNASASTKENLVAFTGVRFPAGYAGLPEKHKLYGGFKRLNAKMGDARVHWFMEGFPGADIDASLVEVAPANHCIDFRAQYLPAPASSVRSTGCADSTSSASGTTGLTALLREHSIKKVYLTGLKASLAVQAYAQMLCDAGEFDVFAVRDCIADDDEDRLKAVVDHLLPVFCTEVISLRNFLGEHLCLEEEAVEQQLNLLNANQLDPRFRYVTDCGRGGHMELFTRCLLQREHWRPYPDQPWYRGYERSYPGGKEYRCPLGKKIVDFADEPQFSKVAMYIKGREFLEDKILFMEIASEFVPKTYYVEGGQWVAGPDSDPAALAPPPDDQVSDACWFVKDALKNWGTAVQLCAKPTECLALCEPRNRYVVQQHVPDPLLTSDGCKVHIKFYMLLTCDGGSAAGTPASTASGDGDTTFAWHLYTRMDGYTSCSPVKWEPTDLTAEGQITIVRAERTSRCRDAHWREEHWPAAYPKCRSAVSAVVGRAIAKNKLKGREGKKQFEILSADFMIDTDRRVWMFEFNLIPVLRDESYSAVVNDMAEIREALEIVMPPADPNAELDCNLQQRLDSKIWDPAGSFFSTASVESARA